MVHTDTVITADQLQQEPLLLLSDTQRVLIPANQASGQTISQPATGACQNLYIFWLKTYFLVQLPVHGFFRGFPVVNPTLGKLPCILPDSPRPKDLTVMIRKYDANIWPESIFVNHACGYLNSIHVRIVS